MKKLLLGLVIIAMLLCLTFTVSAISIKYSDSYIPKDKFTSHGTTGGEVNSINDLIKDKEAKGKKDSIKSNYPKVEISEDKFLGLFGGDPIIDLELVDNTEYCTIDCYSILKVTVHKNTKVMDELETRSFVGNKLEYTNNIETKIYLLKNVSHSIQMPNMEKVCSENPIVLDEVTGVDNKVVNIDKVNAFMHTCDYQENGMITQMEWTEEFVEYNNEELPPGDYIIKITGKKNFNEVIDWVPVISNERIEALAWWNSSTLYGDASLGDIYFSTGTKNYGSMILGTHYTVSGNILYLMTDLPYHFNSLYLGPGTNISTQNSTGAALYIMANQTMNIQGEIVLSNKHLPGKKNLTSFSFYGDSLTTPTTGDGGHALSGEIDGYGFGGGGSSGTSYIGGCSAPTAGAGGNGDYPFGIYGAASSCVSTSDNCIQDTTGATATASGGGGGPCSAYDVSTGYGCTITGLGGAGSYSPTIGNGNYGYGGRSGTSTGTHDPSWLCTSGSLGDGGGGGGGTAGISSYNLVIRARNLTLGTDVKMRLFGTSAGNGGDGGSDAYGRWVADSWSVTYQAGGWGGGGGGGGGGGSLRVYYRYLTNSTSFLLMVNQTGGNKGLGGARGSALTSVSLNGTAGTSGTTTFFREGFTETFLINPANGSSVVVPSIMTFTTNITPYSVTLVNATMYIWNSTSLYTNTTSLAGITIPIQVNWTRTAAQVADGIYNWAVQTCYTDGALNYCTMTQNNTFDTFSLQFTNSTYNNPTYEMLNQTYSVNVTSTGFVTLNATLVWDGVSYSAITGGNLTNAIFTSSIWIPTGTGNKNFFWDVSYGGQSRTSNPENVTVLNSQMLLCNSTSNATFFSISYKDETTNIPIEGTVLSSVWNYNITDSPYGEQFIYSSPIVNGTQATNLTHNFCFIPQYATITISSANYQFGNPTLGYAPKTWPFRVLPLSNSTTNYTLYLINLVDSGTSPVTFQASDSATSSILSGIRIMVFRDIAGVSTLVDDGYTDNAGTIAYYLSPITPYTIVASGSGCNQLTSTITPTSSLYNLLMTCGTSTANQFSTQIDGITYQRTPADGINTPGTTLFSYYVLSVSNASIARVKFDILDARSGSVLATNDSLTGLPGCSNISCLLTLTYTLYTGDNIKGRYYISVNGTNDSDLILIEGDAYWRFIKINQNNSVNAIGRFMLNFQDFFNTWGTNAANCNAYNNEINCNAISDCKWVNWTTWAPKESDSYQSTTYLCVAKDEINKAEFNRIVTIFFFMTIFLFILGRTTGYELNHPGSFVVGMSLVIWALSIYGMFTFAGLTKFDFFNQYIFALSTSCVGIGYAISIIRRYSQ